LSDTPDRSPSSREDLQLHLLVLRCQTGDERAFRRLFEVFGTLTLAHLRGLVGDDAEDVQQDVWLTVFRNLSGLSNPAAFRTWLYRTTRHRAIDYLRRRKREQELVDDVTAVSESAVDPADEWGPDAMDESAFQAALRDLPPLQREALLLRYRDDLSYAEIAVAVGCPIGTVRTRLYNAKRRMSESLKRGLP
jgi:RNA polymerase sigma-70 factor, ECF subfamily